MSVVDGTVEVAVGIPDDEAAMARLDAQVAARGGRDRGGRERVGLTIGAAQHDAAEVIARRHGYDLRARPTGEEGYLWVEFWPRES